MTYYAQDIITELRGRNGEMLDEINRMEREISAYREALEECLDWFKERADGEILIGGPMGNAEMHFSTMIEEILAKKEFK